MLIHGYYIRRHKITFNQIGKVRIITQRKVIFSKNIICNIS